MHSLGHFLWIHDFVHCAHGLRRLAHGVGDLHVGSHDFRLAAGTPDLTLDDERSRLLFSHLDQLLGQGLGRLLVALLRRLFDFHLQLLLFTFETASIAFDSTIDFPKVAIILFDLF